MKTKPNPTKVTRRVKAWALITPDSPFTSHKLNFACFSSGKVLFVVSPFKEDIKRTKPSMVVPCTITYQLPKHKGKKKIR